MLFSCGSAIIGSFAYLRKRALVGDAISHALLPGLCMAFILAGEKNYVFLLTGAFASGLFGAYAVEWIPRFSKIKQDASIAIVLSVLFGIGLLMLTWIQQQENAAQSGLDHFLFGRAAAISRADLLVFGSITFLILLVIGFLFRPLVLFSFDPAFAQAIGLPVKLLNGLLTSLTVLAVVTGIQAVGIVLMSAVLITPAAAARFWTHKLNRILFLAAVFAGLSAATGTFISLTAPNMPTGPWIVVVLSLIALGSFLFAPAKGLVYKNINALKARRQMDEENLLKALYQLSLKQEKEILFDEQYILRQRAIPDDRLRNALSRLKKEGYLIIEGDAIRLSPEGLRQGQRIARLHKLWELYLTTYVRLAPDHVHDDAEAIEHILTPELQADLEQRFHHLHLDLSEENT
jgi:manganese/zinc/iron transport system permease protein